MASDWQLYSYLERDYLKREEEYDDFEWMDEDEENDCYA